MRTSLRYRIADRAHRELMLALALERSADRGIRSRLDPSHSHWRSTWRRYVRRANRSSRIDRLLRVKGVRPLDQPAPSGGRPLAVDRGRLRYLLDVPDVSRREVLVRSIGEPTVGLDYVTDLQPVTRGYRVSVMPGGGHEYPAGFAFTRAGALRKAKRAIRAHLARVAANMP